MSIFIIVGAYRYYARLAEKFGKTKWHYGLLAIALYLGFQFAFMICYRIFEIITNPDSLNDNNYTSFSLINLIGWVLAISGVYVVYYFLEKKFEKENLRKPLWEIDEIGAEKKKDNL